MSLSKLFARAAFAAALAWSGGAVALAADVVPPRPIAPAVAGGAPVIVEREAAPGGCATCQHGAAASTCPRCSKWLSWHKNKPPFQVTLCPGACFGYFQTQWRKWDDVCPYPYLGTGASDAGRLPGVVPRAPSPTGAPLTPPRTIEPKMPEPKMPANAAPGIPKGGSDLPVIPSAPGKFNP
jgi:hypothetical protein